MLSSELCVNIINCAHRTDRKESSIQQMREQGITNYIFWEGIIHNQPFTGIARAYKQIIKYAKDNKLPIVAIMEDDCIFSSPHSWDYFISQIPKDPFDIFLSSIYWGDILPDNSVKEFSGFTLSIFHESFYDKFLSTPENNHIDRQMKIHEGIYYVCNPFIAFQQDGFSDNSGRITDYNKTYLYGRKILDHSGF